MTHTTFHCAHTLPRNFHFHTIHMQQMCSYCLKPSKHTTRPPTVNQIDDLIATVQPDGWQPSAGSLPCTYPMYIQSQATPRHMCRIFHVLSINLNFILFLSHNKLFSSIPCFFPPSSFNYNLKQFALKSILVCHILFHCSSAALIQL